MESNKMIPTWAPRVTQQEIRRLYETDAKGIYDDDLIAEVGYGLLSRCQSFLDANEAVEGRVRCPSCAAIVLRASEILHCVCGWELSWAEYFKTIQHMQLSGAEPVREMFRSFVEQFPSARTPQERVLLIDRLIHGFHWYYKNSTNCPTRPVAVNLIEGRMGEVLAFLDELTNGERSTPGKEETLAEWRKNVEASLVTGAEQNHMKKAEPAHADDAAGPPA